MEALAAFGQFMGGLGFFFLGVGMLWLVSVYKERRP